MIKNKEIPELVGIEGGVFKMGSYNQEYAQPIHLVKLSSFHIGKYPITVGQYQKFCAATRRLMPQVPFWGLQENYPIVDVSRLDAIAYCNWLCKCSGGSWRLPTEAEWEYAAVGGKMSKGYRYSGSNDIDTVAWYNKNAESAMPVGMKQPNELGVYDMSGNVDEWCYDRYGYDYYAKSPLKNPRGTNAGYPNYIIRGGSWNMWAEHCEVTNRNYKSSSFKYFSLGFRVVLIGKRL